MIVHGSETSLPGVAGAHVEGVMILHFAARRAFELAVEGGLLGRTELEADAVGEPSTAEVGVEVLVKVTFGGFSVGVTEEVVVHRSLRVESTRIAFKLPAGAGAESGDQHLEVVLFDLDAGLGREIVASDVAVGEFNLRFHEGAFEELEVVTEFCREAEGVVVVAALHVARRHVRREATDARDRIDVSTRFKESRTVDREGVAVRIRFAVRDVGVTVGVAEGAAHNPVAEATVETDLHRRLVDFHVDGVGVGAFTAVDAGPGTHRGGFIANVAETLREVIDFIAPGHEGRSVDAFEGIEFRILGDARGKHLAFGVHRLGDLADDAERV